MELGNLANFRLGSPVWEPAGKYLREEELPAQRLRRGTGVSTSLHHACPLKHDRSRQLPLPLRFWQTPAKRAEGTRGEAQTHLKWSWRGANSLEMVLESHVEVKSIPSVDKADSDESSAAWRRRKSKEGLEPQNGRGRGWGYPIPHTTVPSASSSWSWDSGD